MSNPINLPELPDGLKWDVRLSDNAWVEVRLIGEREQTVFEVRSYSAFDVEGDVMTAWDNYQAVQATKAAS